MSAGQIAMFGKYPNWKMVVYPTHRSASFPQRIYEYSIKNAATGELVDDGEGVARRRRRLSVPDPRQGSGQGRHGSDLESQAEVQGRVVRALEQPGDRRPHPASTRWMRFREEGLGLYYKPGNTLKDINNILLYFFEDVVSPPRLAGQVLLVHETLDSKKEPRQAWIYNPGQRRVRRAPNVAYDNPGTASDGLRTNDMTDMFNGALDKYDWKLVGKKEMYVPYNSYKAHSDKTKVERPDQAELHQSGLVALRAASHLGRRSQAQAGPAPHQSAPHVLSRRGQLADPRDRPLRQRRQAVALFRSAERELLRSAGVLVDAGSHYDLKSGRYLVQGLDNQEQEYDFSFQTTPDMFSPQSLRQRGIE